MDTRTLSRLIDSIYDAGLGGRSWHAVTGEVAAAFGEQGGILYEFDARKGQSQILGATSIDPRVIAEYEEYYGGIDDWNRRILAEPTLEANATHNLIRDSDLERTEFCNDYLRRLDYFYAMGGIVRRRAGRTTVLGVQRSRRRGHYGRDDFDAVEILIRHVDRSLEIAERLSRASQPAGAETDKGFILLDATGRVTFGTQIALGLLERTGITLRDGGLSSADGRGEALTHALAQLRQKSDGGQPAGEALDLAMSDGGCLAIVALGSAHALPAMAGFSCIMLERRPPRADAGALLQERFRLTGTEAVLALSLADGVALRELAGMRGVSINTLRVQLQAVFAKTGCHRQSELVRLVLDLKRG